MFEPEKVVRDEWGYWTHAGVAAAAARHREEDISALPEVAGMEVKYVEFFDDANEELQDLYAHGEGLDGDEKMLKRAVRQWEPTPPEGDGWFLLSIYDSDDGPYACFARPLGVTAEAGR